MKAVTVDEIMAWGPCPDYPQERVEELMAGREVITPDEIAELDIDADSILWALLHQEFLPAFDIRELACDFAERIAIKRDCTTALEFISKIRAWNRGKLTDDEFGQIKFAYWAAWWGTKDYNVASDWAANWAADWDACWAAYWAACGADDSQADSAADTEAERLWQIQRVLERIRTIRD